jgi:hypothetical protein
LQQQQPHSSIIVRSIVQVEEVESTPVSPAKKAFKVTPGGNNGFGYCVQLKERPFTQLYVTSGRAIRFIGAVHFFMNPKMA